MKREKQQKRRHYKSIRRERFVTARLSDEEHLTLRAAALRSHTRVSILVRDAVLGRVRTILTEMADTTETAQSTGTIPSHLQ